MIYPASAVYFCGSSRLPQTIPSAEAYKSINVGYVIDTATGEILDVSTTLLSKGATAFIQSLAIGFNVHEHDTQILIDEIRSRYYGGSQKAVVVASRTAFKEYESWCIEHNI